MHASPLVQAFGCRRPIAARESHLNEAWLEEISLVIGAYVAWADAISMQSNGKHCGAATPMDATSLQEPFPRAV